MADANDILSFHGRVRSDYLHGKGELATNFLLSQMPAKQQILEIGCGTGATLVKTKSKWPSANLYGIEPTEAMYVTAAERLQACGLDDQISLLNQNWEQAFASIDHEFGLIYCESVFAIFEGEALRRALEGVFQKLESGGSFHANETLWLPRSAPEDRERVNQLVKERLGIIQANHDYPTANEWVELMTEIGFTSVSVEPIETTGIDAAPTSSWEEKSRSFSKRGKLKAKLLPGLRREQRKVESSTKGIITKENQLEAYYICGIKP